MQKLTSLVFGALVSLLAAATANAQGAISVPPGILKPGESIKIEYSNPLRANQTIQIEISDGGYPNEQTTTVEIKLNASGEGSANWTVPEWNSAYFNGPEAGEVVRTIGSLPDPAAFAGRPSESPRSEPAPALPND